MPSAAPRFHPAHGELIDLGGRRIRLVRSGERGAAPAVLCEAGSFGSAADWSVVQAQLAAKDIHSIAYDRAGTGFSDPGPNPRDGLAIADDLERLLRQAGEDGPFVLLGHSMAGLWVQLFALRNPERVLGLVLVDAATPKTSEATFARRWVDRYARATWWWAKGARLGLAAPAAVLRGDIMELGPAGAEEKRRVFSLPGHHRAAADEVANWHRAAAQARAAGDYRTSWPVAVVTAGVHRRLRLLKEMQAEPATASRFGYVDHVAGANHANLLGRRFATRIVAAVEHVLAAPSA